MKENHIVKNATLTNLTKFLNDSSMFEKHTKKPFTTNDVRQYILLGHIPYYMGGNIVEESDMKAEGVKLYNLRG